MDRQEILKRMGSEIVSEIMLEALDTSTEMVGDLEGLIEYVAARTGVLALSADEPGFNMAIEAERDNIALYATTEAVTRADEVDRRILAVIRGSIVLAARGVSLLVAV